MSEPKLILKSLNEVNKAIKAVPMVNMQRFKARHYYDLVNMVQPLFAEHGIFITRELIDEDVKEVQSQKGSKGTHRTQRWKFIFHAVDGSSVSTEFPAESIDWGDKSSSQCDAMAFKQMLIHTFQIPTEGFQDPDNKPAPEPMKPSQSKTVTMPQIKRLMAIVSETEWSNEHLKELLAIKFEIDSSKKLTNDQYKELIDIVTKQTPEEFGL